MGADMNLEKCKIGCRSLSGSCDSRKHFLVTCKYHICLQHWAWASWKPATATSNAERRTDIGFPNFSSSVEQHDGGRGSSELIWPNPPSAVIPAFGLAVKFLAQLRVTSETWAPCRCRPEVSHHLILLCLNLSHSNETTASKHPQYPTDAAFLQPRLSMKCSRWMYVREENVPRTIIFNQNVTYNENLPWQFTQKPNNWLNYPPFWKLSSVHELRADPLISHRPKLGKVKLFLIH